MSPVLDLYIRAIGFIYLIAFFSLFRELNALYSKKGIASISLVMNGLKKSRSFNYFNLPTLFWFDSSDKFIKILNGAGLVLSLVVMAFGVSPIALFLLYIIYLSFQTVGSPFLDFQWDILLIESGFYTFLLSLNPAFQFPMTVVILILFFRLVFASIVVKIRASTDYWRKLTALDYHYESQPIPNWVAFFCHNQPKWVSRLSAIGVFFFEGVVPWFMLFGYLGRSLCFFFSLIFQIFISMTGNFTFFNLLSMAISIPLLVDFGDIPLGSLISWGISAPFIFGNLALTAQLFLRNLRIPFLRRFRSWGLFNPYGLFANMTVGRKEIIIEGSNDNEHWLPYVFKYKPQNTDEAPPQLAPLQARLEWQLWFLALNPGERAYWFDLFLLKILEGDPDILFLFKTIPFKTPPKYLRVLLYDYKFNTIAEWRRRGHYWTRTLHHVLYPSVSLKAKS